MDRNSFTSFPVKKASALRSLKLLIISNIAFHTYYVKRNKLLPTIWGFQRAAAGRGHGRCIAPGCVWVVAHRSWAAAKIGSEWQLALSLRLHRPEVLRIVRIAGALVLRLDRIRVHRPGEGY